MKLPVRAAPKGTEMTTGVSISGLSTDLKTGLAFLTRLPLAGSAPATGSDIAHVSWTFPVVGAGVGAFGALVYWLADGLGLDPILSAILAVAATLLITGALHEDGLADTADGFGASVSRERKLDIMRDSEIGTYGASALILSFMLRVGAVGESRRTGARRIGADCRARRRARRDAGVHAARA